MNKFQSIIIISILIVLAQTNSTRRLKNPSTKPAHLTTTVVSPTRRLRTTLRTARTTEPSTESFENSTKQISKGGSRSKNPGHKKPEPIIDPPIYYDYEEYEKAQEIKDNTSDDTKFDEKEEENGGRKWKGFELVFVVLMVLKL